ncbi:MAG: dTDP-4-dehydrorhamnose reductase [Cyanobacteria bacterium P01_A01_bin.105]
MHYLLLGANGQVGQTLQPQLNTLGTVTALGRQQLDLAEPETIRSCLLAMKPDVIINAAAYTAVDRAESEPALAHTVNGVAPTVMAEVAEQTGARLLHLSTDYVFDGQHHRPYDERHVTRPLSCYGQSKAQGERGIAQTGANAVVLRTAWVYGAQGHSNFVKTMLRVGAQRDELQVVVDQVSTPTWAVDIARTICQLVQKPAVFQPGGEIFHFTNSGVASWYDFAMAIREMAMALGLPWCAHTIRPIPTEAYPLPAPRPAYSVLSNQKITRLLGQAAPHWQTSLSQMLTSRMLASQRWAE